MLLLSARIWVGLVGVVALGNALQCFVDEAYPKTRLYTVRPEEASPLLSRMFGVWTLLAATVRLVFALSPPNHSIWLVAFLSFIFALLHFCSEIFIYKTAIPSFATLSPLVVASTSVIWLLVALPSLNASGKKEQTENKSKKT